MKYKLAIIIFIGSLITILIYFQMDKKGLNFLALGDGIASGMTPFHVEGYNYNDYISDYLLEKNNLNNYYKNFNETEETTTTLLTKIANNISDIDKKIKIKQAIKESDIITISLGMDELNTYASKKLLASSKISGFLKKYEELLQEIKKINNNQIIVIGLYESNLINNQKIAKINEDLQKLCQKYQVTFINISEITKNKEYFLTPKSYYPNYKGQEYIFNKIKQNLNSPIFTTI